MAHDILQGNVLICSMCCFFVCLFVCFLILFYTMLVFKILRNKPPAVLQKTDSSSLFHLVWLDLSPDQKISWLSYIFSSLFPTLFPQKLAGRALFFSVFRRRRAWSERERGLAQVTARWNEVEKIILFCHLFRGPSCRACLVLHACLALAFVRLKNAKVKKKQKQNKQSRKRPVLQVNRTSSWYSF